LWAGSRTTLQTRPLYKRKQVSVALLTALLGAAAGGFFGELRLRHFVSDLQAKLEKKEQEVEQKEQIAQDLKVKNETMEKTIRELQAKVEGR
jgi:uncharacterized protein YlxW (UPF0749 family)